MVRKQFKKIYNVKEGGIIKKKDAQIIGEYIERIGVKNPRVILSHAKRDKNCPLNKYLDWNDRVAGDNWRLHQIRNIVNHLEVSIIYDGNTEPVKAFYSITEFDKDLPEYVNQEDVYNNDDWRKQIVARALNEQYSWVERYKLFGELSPIVKFLRPYIKHLGAKKKYKKINRRKK
jgi:hypothetical protein